MSFGAKNDVWVIILNTNCKVSNLATNTAKIDDKRF